MEAETRRFYERASARTQDASLRQLLDDLVQEERHHEERAEELGKGNLNAQALTNEADRPSPPRVPITVLPQRVDMWSRENDAPAGAPPKCC